MTSLNPVYTVGEQIAETVRQHEGLSRRAAHRPRGGDAAPGAASRTRERRVNDYPHQFSGGMRQRVMIAMALSCNPKLLIADEPTTALDVTIQAQILDLLNEMKQRLGMAVLLITHAMGVVAETAQRVVVMYAGKVVEEAPVGALFADPRHPYTQGLIRSIPRLDLAATEHRRLEAIPGTVPSLLNPPPGCRFAARCRHAIARLPSRPSRRCARWRPATRWPASCDREDPLPMTEPLLRVENLVKRFAVKGGLLRRTVDAGACRQRRQLRPGGGRDAWPGRRIRLRQVHDRAADPAADRADLGRRSGSRAGRHRASTATSSARLRRDMQIIFQDPYASLNPRMTVGAIVGEALVIHGLAEVRAASARTGWWNCWRRSA